MRLVIIEAIGKRATVQKAAQQIWGTDIAVLSTGGYIWTFPNDKIGIDAETLRPNADMMTSNGRHFYQELVKLEQRIGGLGWEEAILLTDPDREGEGIAEQAKHLIHRIFIDIPIRRIYAHELNAYAIQQSPSSNDTHLGMHTAQTARRVLDRLLPLSAAHAIGKQHDFQGLGRLQTATLRVTKDKSSQWKRYVLEGRWRTVEGDYFVREYSDNKNVLSDMRSTLMRFGSYADAKHESMNLTIPPPSAHSAFSLIVSLLHIRPEDTMKALQQSYMQGRMSYPRTDQTALGNFAIDTTASIAENLHLGHAIPQVKGLRTENLSVGMNVQGAHPALHPTLIWSPTAGKPTTVGEQVEAEVAARAIASIMRPAVVNRKLVTVLTENGNLLQAVQDSIVEAGWTQAYTRVGLHNPLDPTPKLGPRFPTIIDQFPTLAHVVEWLHDEKLGRPSTIANLPARMQQLGLLSIACVPTREGEDQLKTTQKVMRAYTYPGFTRTMENGLNHLLDHPQNYTAVIRNLLSEAGADVIGLPTVINNAKPDYQLSPSFDDDSDLDIV